MALFLDGNISPAERLAAHDSSVLAVCATEGIDLTVKAALAHDDLALELALLLPAGDSLAAIVVTPALRLWHSFHTLELVYRDAYAGQLNDRYAARRDQFAALSRWTVDKLIRAGVGMATNPISRAPAPVLTYVPGSLRAATYYVCISWVTADGREGAAGDYVSLPVPDDNVLSVRAPAAPSNAAGWHVYVGLTPDALARQNPAPLALGQPWLQSAAVSAGDPPGAGQAPDFTRTVARTALRG